MLSVAIVAICDYFIRLAIIFAFWLQNLAIIFHFQQCLHKVQKSIMNAVDPINTSGVDLIECQLFIGHPLLTIARGDKNACR
jgi:hypothetical protein